MIIVGCPVKNDLECLKFMISSLYISSGSFDELILVDGGSTDGTIEFIDSVMAYNPKVKLVQLFNKTPLDAYNKLFEIAKEKKANLLLTQTDVIFPSLYKRDWLIMMRNASVSEDVGAVIPLNGGKYSGSDYINGFFWLGGWCTYVPYRSIDLIGGYDTAFPSGFGVDIDWSYRLTKVCNLKIAIIDYFVDHHMQNSRTHDYDSKAEQMKQDSAKYFRKKWNLGEFAVPTFGGGIEGL